MRPSAYLLHGGVFDRVRVVPVVDDFKVFNSIPFVGTGEDAVHVSFACSFGVHSEVGGFVQFHT